MIINKTGLLIVFLFLLVAVNAQKRKNTPNQKKIEQLVSNEAFSDALQLALKGLNVNNKNGYYLYYAGYCYLKLNRDADSTINYLKSAAQQDYNKAVHFYLGVAYFNHQQADLAKISFNNFASISRKRQQKKYNLADWLSKTDSLKKAIEIAQIAEQENNKIVKQEAVKSKTVSPLYSKKDSLIFLALQEQLIVDSLEHMKALFIKQKLVSKNEAERTEYVKKIIRTNKSLKSSKQKIANWYDAADINFEHNKSIKENRDYAESQENIKKFSLKTEHNQFELVTLAKQKQKWPQPMDEMITSQLSYCIQLGVYGKLMKNIHFNGLSPISFEKTNDEELYKHYVGKFDSTRNAKQALKVVKLQGFNDAFIISFYEGKKIPIEKAREIEFSRSMQ